MCRIARLLSRDDGLDFGCGVGGDLGCGVGGRATDRPLLDRNTCTTGTGGDDARGEESFERLRDERLRGNETSEVDLNDEFGLELGDAVGVQNALSFFEGGKAPTHAAAEASIAASSATSIAPSRFLF